MNITCPVGIIFIEKAIFGRTEDERVCNDTRIKTTNCTSTKSEAIVKEECDGMQKCNIIVTNTKLGGDPCAGTYKYLVVNFICY